MKTQTSLEITKKFAIGLKSNRTCFFYSDKINAYARIRWLNEDERISVDVSPTLNLPHRATRRSDNKYIFWHENEELRDMVNSSLYELLGSDIKKYQELIIDKNGELAK